MLEVKQDLITFPVLLSMEKALLHVWLRRARELSRQREEDVAGISIFQPAVEENLASS